MRAARRSGVLEVEVEDGHLKLITQFAVLIIDRQRTNEVLADVDLRRVLDLRARPDGQGLGAEHLAHIILYPHHFLRIHGRSPYPQPQSSGSSRWSMVRAGSGQPAGPTTLAGTTATVLSRGKSLRSPLPEATREQLPTRMLPNTLAPAPIITLSPILG